MCQKMKTIVYTCILLAATFFFASCEKDGSVDTNNTITADTTSTTSAMSSANTKNSEPSEPEEVYEPEGVLRRKNFISSYYDATRIYIASYDKNSSEYPVIKISVGGVRYATGNSKYDEIAEKFGDTHYNGYNDPTYEAIDDTVKTIDIISTEDFDDLHPKGASLSDITSVVIASPHKYLTSGYHDEFTQDQYDSVYNLLSPYNIYFHYHYAVMYDKMQNIVPDDVKLFYPEFYVIFDQLPAKKGTYTFDVSVNFSETSFVRSVDIEF